jgi:hypothetical protein
MSARIAAFIRQNVTGLIAIFIALGGTAYANNEWTGANIVDGSLTTFDYKNDDIRSADVHDTTLKAADLAPDAIYDDKLIPTQGSTRIAPNAIQESELSDSSVFSPEVANSSLTGSDVKDNSLTGSDINESTLSPFGLPGPVSFTFSNNDTGQICNSYCTEGSLKFIPPGTYLLMGKIDPYQTDDSSGVTWVDCQLVAGSDPATHDVDSSGYTLYGDTPDTTLPMQVIHTFESTDNASIQCRDFDKGSAFGQSLRITALKVGAVNGTVTR